MSTFEETLGRKIARIRRALGWSQARLAEQVGVQPETLSRIEHGRRAMSIRLALRLASALHLRLFELFQPEGEGTPKDKGLEYLMIFARRLSADEIDLVLDVGAIVVQHARRFPRVAPAEGPMSPPARR